ncbi:hypothetical protein B7463_g11263, partial [Scytalidium lignicola]
MDETGFQVGVTPGEEVIVPVEIKELYEGIFQNRKSVTVIEYVSADGKAPIPPVILVEGIWIMESWVQENLPDHTCLISTEKGYTNNEPKEPEPTLPTLPATPKTAHHSVQALEELETHIPEVFSSPSAHQKQESQIKKIYLEDLKEWRAKEKERKAAIRRITQGRKTKQHLVPAYLLVETPNKPVDPTTLQGTTISINEEQEVDFILDSTYNFQSSQYTAVENVVERPGTVVDDPWVTDITHTTTATATATTTTTTTTTTTATKPLWLDQDFMEFE